MNTKKLNSPLPAGEGQGEGGSGPGPSSINNNSLLSNLQTNPNYRSPYGPRQKTPIYFAAKGRTKQEFQNECDINQIMARFDKTGVLAFTNRFQPQYGDCTGIEFQNSMETIATGRSMFQELPSGLRARFKNDPAAFLDFIHDDRNYEEARELGLLRPSDAQGTPLAKGTGQLNQEAGKGSEGESKSRPGSSEPGRGAEGAAKSERSSEKTA